MEYRFLDQDDDTLIATSELPCDSGIAVAVRSTGYDLESDEVVELAIVSFSGDLLFKKRVKPQNKETWDASEASGGLSPDDVADDPELYQFEEEISDLFEKAKTVVCQHEPFMSAVIEASWVSLPAFKGVDVMELFCRSHETTDYPGQPAAAAALPGIAAYYGLPAPDGTLEGEAALLVMCYRAIVEEHARERKAKGDAYWARYDEERADDRAKQERIEAVRRMREHRLNQMNGLLWIAGALIFISLAIQWTQRGGDAGIVIICVAIAAFAAFRGIVNFRR